MSDKRPGTVDYSKWDNLELSDDSSDDEEEEDEETILRKRRRRMMMQVPMKNEEEEESNSEDKGPGRQEPLPTLAALQRAWNTDITITPRPCSHCFTPNAQYKCSRCQLVRYCNVSCQSSYHPIHKLECIDARQHQKYWGMFDSSSNKSGEEDGVVDDFAVLRARRSSKRRRALQKAAAAVAVERARRARMAQGGAVNKGGGGKGKGADEREEECSICNSEFTVQGDGGVAFCCPTSHYMCNECAGIWVNSVVNDLDSSFPPKCPMCKALFSQDLFVRQLTTSQQNSFKTHVARTSLKEGEELLECKVCGLFEVVSDDPVLWWCPHCSCGACRVCNKDLPPGVSKCDTDKFPHKKCVELREPKRLIEQAIEDGSKMRCPGCQLAGRKDDACTHMTCTKCSTEWCYVCGLDVKSCDKEAPQEGKPVNDIYLHNRDWEINEKRCPMYLTSILEIDLHWLGENWEENASNEDFEDDEKCLDYFHRFRTIKLLQDVLENVGKKAFISAFIGFESIQNCGYTYADVVSTCTDHLIDRREYLKSRRLGVDNHGGFAFEDEAQGVALDEIMHDDVPLVDIDAIEQRLVDEALHRSEETAAEDDQLRQALSRSVEESDL